MPSCRILFLAASPADEVRVAVGRECREIEQKAHVEDRGVLELIHKDSVRLSDLFDYLNRYQPRVLHFSGHGTVDNEIILVDDQDKASPLSAEALQDLLGSFKDSIQVVVLNACFSEGQARGIVEHIDCAVGMSDAILDEAAISFAATFYLALGFGRSVGNAFQQALTMLKAQGLPDEHIPMLLCRSGVDPDQLRLVDVPASPPRPPDVPEAPTTYSQPQSPSQQPWPSQPPPPPPSPGLLSGVLPGSWQIQIQTAFSLEHMVLEVAPSHFFRGQLGTPMGPVNMEGQWQADDATRQISLQGVRTMGFQSAPYVVFLQVNSFDQQQLVGVTPIGETVTWQRVG